MKVSGDGALGELRSCRLHLQERLMSSLEMDQFSRMPRVRVGCLRKPIAALILSEAPCVYVCSSCFSIMKRENTRPAPDLATGDFTASKTESPNKICYGLNVKCPLSPWNHASEYIVFSWWYCLGRTSRIQGLAGVHRLHGAGL